MKYAFILLLFPMMVRAQSPDLVYVKLNEWAKNERFDKLQIVIPFYLVQNDTIETFDFENLRDSKKVRIRKPEGHRSYAYGYLFFRGIPNTLNEGFVNILMVDLAERDPRLYIDRNNNYDFTDDSASMHVPMPFNRKQDVVIELARADRPNAKIAIRLSRMDFSNQYSYKNLLNEYYQIYGNGKQFAGIEYCFREQRYQTRSGIVRLADDSFRIALQDENSNGLYDDADTDKLITANLGDSAFDSKDELHASILGKEASARRFEKNGKLFEILNIDPSGTYLTLREVPDSLLGRKLKPGAKVSNFTFIDWEGNKGKLKKFRKQHVFVYFTGPQSKNFSEDTAALRQIATEFGSCVKVIGFIDVNKSYELKIFGSYSNLNWVAAYKNKYVVQDLGIRGLPASVWIGKRRRFKQYNLTPQEFLKELRRLDQAP